MLWDTFKLNLMKWLPAGLILFCAISFPLIVGVMALQEIQSDYQKVTVSDRPLIDIEKPLQQFLTQMAQANQQKPRPVEALPKSMTSAITRMSDDINRLAQLVEQQREISALLISNSGGNHVMKPPFSEGMEVDRNGNTEEALNDLYSPVNVPVLPDALAKGLARYPGSRVVVHPEAGVPVLSNCEWVYSHGGRVQELKRLNGIERPISIHYSAPMPVPEPKPEPFRLNLGNN